MKKVLFAAFAALFVATGCDSTLDSKFQVYSCVDKSKAGNPAKRSDCTPLLDMLCRERSSGVRDRDGITACATEKIGASNLMWLQVGMDPAFETTVLLNNAKYAQLNRRVEPLPLGTVIPAGSDFYIRVSMSEPVEWPYVGFADIRTSTQTHRVSCRDNGGFFEAYDTCEVSVLAAQISCLDQSIGGVAFCYYWDTQECVLSNDSQTAVHFLMEVPERGTVLVEEVYMTPGETSTVACRDLKAGDTVVAKAWIGLVESIVDRVRGRAADVQATFIFSDETLIPISSLQEQDVVSLPIEQTGGVNCIVEKVYEEGEALHPSQARSLSDSLVCENKSADKVEVELYKLAPNAVTPGTYVVDFKLAEFNLAAKDPSKDPEIGETQFSASGEEGAFMLVVRTDGWWNNPNLLSYQLMEIAFSDAGWQIRMLPDSSLAGAVPAD